MGTQEAFKNLISKRNWYVGLGITQAAASGIANRFRKGNLSIEKIEDVLGKAGFVVVVERVWERVAG